MLNKPYPIASNLFKKFKEKITELLEKGTIVPSNASTTSPVFIANKSNGDIRIIVDYRKINQHIVDDGFFFPGIYDSIERLKNMKFFSKIDLSSSFYQIPISKCSQDITSFICPLGQYKFTTLPFGLKSSPKLFQRVISNILNKVSNIIIFVDDILIYNETEKEHLEKIDLVINTLQQNSLEINFGKCIFMKTTIDYLGMNIDGVGYKAELKKLKESIENFIPKTKKVIKN